MFANAPNKISIVESETFLLDSKVISNPLKVYQIDDNIAIVQKDKVHILNQKDLTNEAKVETIGLQQSIDVSTLTVSNKTPIDQLYSKLNPNPTHQQHWYLSYKCTDSS
jgi:thymidylate synthase